MTMTRILFSFSRTKPGPLELFSLLTEVFPDVPVALLDCGYHPLEDGVEILWAFESNALAPVELELMDNLLDSLGKGSDFMVNVHRLYGDSLQFVESPPLFTTEELEKLRDDPKEKYSEAELRIINIALGEEILTPDEIFDLQEDQVFTIVANV